MAVVKWDIVYLPDMGRKPDRVVISLLDQLKASREKNEDEEIPYKVWSAATREGKTDKPFEDWAATVGALSPVYTNERLDELLLTGNLKEETADRIRATFTESGESPAPRTA